MQNAERGIASLKEKVDTLVVIPNDRLMQVVERKTTFSDAFIISDEILRQGVQGISDLIAIPGLINLDFADVKTIMYDTGMAHMGIGRASGENRAEDAAKQAIQSPLLETSIEGARGVIINITGSSEVGLLEANTAAELIQRSADPEANIIFGTVTDDSMGDEIQITVIATGFEKEEERTRSSIPGYENIVSEAWRKRNTVTSSISSSSSPAASSTTSSISDVTPGSELDIPTFLRKNKGLGGNK